jgi:(p)ppGpp synthase/HD superfamily hydrolase
MGSELKSDTQRVLRAIRYAALKHRNQTLSDGLTPYLSHVFRVTYILFDLFGVDDEDTIVATILHDVVEDTGTPAEEIAQLFGATAARYVEALTKNESLPKSLRDREYAEKLFNASEIVQIAKLADIYDNLSARIGTPKLESTLENARRITAGFKTTIRTRRGRNALCRVAALIGEIEGQSQGDNKPSQSGQRERNLLF